jgi:hypothetical protein
VKDAQNIPGLTIGEGQHLADGRDEAAGKIVRRRGGLDNPGGSGGGIGEGDIGEGATDVDGEGAAGAEAARISVLASRHAVLRPLGSP